MKPRPGLLVFVLLGAIGIGGCAAAFRGQSTGPRNTEIQLVFQSHFMGQLLPCYPP